ncbi:MAG: cadherin-like beta sandwich domain-containing protein, partial [Chloroflexi bacterium]|nr:cadherin-like beta sandwich domain-containing protein [Chloroflexota bacterium]
MRHEGRLPGSRPLIAVGVISALLLALTPLASVALAEAGTPGERLSAFDIDPLPGDGKQDARGVCSDGTTMWVVEERGYKLFAYTLEQDALTRNENGDISLSGQNVPGGCTTDGTTIWVADDEVNKLVAYNIADKDPDTAKDFTTLTGTVRLTGIAADSLTMWVADVTDKKLYAYVLADRTPDSTRNIALHEDNTTPQGLWTDGTTMWVADNTDAHFFAYELATGDRDTAKEFAATDATNVQGIWSNGSVLWAVNRAAKQVTGNKVLAYRMPVSLSSDASLSALALSGVTLSPAFAAGTTGYTAAVGHGVTATTVTATASDENASVAVTPGDADGGTEGHQVDLPVGEAVITVE